MGVTKGVGGSPEIAEILTAKGMHTLADTKLKNLQDMRRAGIQAEFLFLRTPAVSEAEIVVEAADISMNTELSVLKSLSVAALNRGIIHRVILMIEMGDLREGILPADLSEFIGYALSLKGIAIVGLGANFACFGGVKPSNEKMQELEDLTERMEAEFPLTLSYITGGNSGNYRWFSAAASTGRINSLRIGESIYLGCETLEREEIPGLFTDAFTLVAEVIEAKRKPSLPYGEIGQNAAGGYSSFQDQGEMNRAILAIGSQDVIADGLTPMIDIEILGSSSDHLIVNAKETKLVPGTEVSFGLNYSALLSLMTSAYIPKKYFHSTIMHQPG